MKINLNKVLEGFNQLTDEQIDIMLMALHSLDRIGKLPPGANGVACNKLEGVDLAIVVWKGPLAGQLAEIVQQQAAIHRRKIREIVGDDPNGAS